MKKNIFLLFILITLKGLCQVPIIVQNASKSELYNDLQTALDNITNSDTLYLNGYSFNGDFTIDKSIVLFGVGYRIDSSGVIDPTIFENLYLTADDITISGLKANNVFLGTSSVNQPGNFSISNCHLGSLYLSFDGSTENTNSNFIIRNCFVDGTIFIGNADNVTIENNIARSIQNSYKGSVVIRNNHFIQLRSVCSSSFNTSSYPIIDNFQNGYFANNVFFNLNELASGTWTRNLGSFNGDTNNCLFENNLFNFIHDFGTNTTFSNLVEQYSDIFGELPPISGSCGSTSYLVFEESTFYDLSPTSVGKNAATDGSDIGAFGGNFSWNYTSTSIPKIKQNNTSTSLDENNRLNVNITVISSE